MSIGVVCPHCELTLQLQPEMAGRSIRCPNPECRETFVVPQASIPATVPTAKPIPTAKAVQLPSKPKEVRWSEDLVRPVDKPTPKPPATKEVRWSDDLERPAEKPALKPPMRKVVAPPLESKSPETAEPIRSQPKRSNHSPMLLAVLSVLLLLGVAGLGIFYIVHTQRAEQRLQTEAEGAYSSGQYAESAKKYKQLGEEYPESERKPRYDFFAKLAELQASINSPSAKDRPQPSLDSFKEFAAAHAESPLAKPGTGFGADIVQAGQKLANLAHDHVAAELKLYKTDRKNGERLANAETVSAKTKELIANLERFRDKDSPSSKELLQKFETLAVVVAEERRRAASIADWRTVLQEPTQAKIEQFLDAMHSAGLGEDEETIAIVAAARKILLSQIQYVSVRKAAVALPADVAEPELSAPPVPGSPRSRPSLNSKEETCFGIASGCLYACDAHTGEYLWGRRVAPPTANRATVDLPVLSMLPDSKGEIVIVGLQRADGAGIAAMRARTGEALWYQPLDAPCYARPAIIGTHLFVGLRDDAGTIIEFDMISGERLGSISLQQPLGANLQSFPGEQPDRGFIVAVCQSQRVIVLESGRETADGISPPLTCVKSLSTGHAVDAILTDPLIVPSVDSAEPSSLFLTLATGPTHSKLIEYRLPSRKELSGPIAEGEIAEPRIAEKAFAGWPWFPAVSDGERLALATDTGRLSLFGITAKTGGLHPLLPENAKETDDSISRACAVALDDDALWAIVGEQLVQYKSQVNNLGIRTVPLGKPRRTGEAAMRPQVVRSANLGIVGVQPSPTDRIQMLAFDLETGETRWQVELKSQEAK